ncbi:hypothetical protein LG293_17375 (plasmid) [Citricoccus nitrophenolicus]
MKTTKRAAAKAAQIAGDADKLLAYMDREGIDGGTGSRTPRAHMGGLIADSALQRQQKYLATVVPRVNGLIEAWPDANTTTGFLDRSAAGTLSSTVNWPEGERIVQMQATAQALAVEGVETVEQMLVRFTDESTRLPLRQALRRVPNVGAKTTDYLEILSGSEKVAAIDVRIRRATGRAGIVRTGYFYLQDVLNHAAAQRGWTVGSLDVVLWNSHKA